MSNRCMSVLPDNCRCDRVADHDGYHHIYCDVGTIRWIQDSIIFDGTRPELETILKRKWGYEQHSR